MASSLSSLGLGSQGALNYDIIEQLRAADDSVQVKPLEAKLTENEILQSDLSMLTTFTASLKSMTSSLSSENTYLKRSTTVTGTSASVTAAAGTTIQDISIDVTNLALKDVYESRAFSEKTSTFTTEADTIQLSIDGETYDIDVDATTTLSELKDKIFDKTDGKVSASILNVGGTDPYKLIIQSSETGKDNAITISSTTGSAISLGLSNYEYVGDTAGTFSGTDKIPEVQTLTFGAASSDGNITVAGITIPLLSTDDTAEKVGAKVQAALNGNVGTNVTDNLDGTITITYNSDGVDEVNALFDDTDSTGVSYLVVEDTKGGEGDILTFTINGTDYDISVDDGDTATDISNKIVVSLGDILNSKVENGILLLESLDGNMSVSSLNGSDVTFGLDAMAPATQSNHIQSATDASFKFGGVDITRDSNSFDDLIVGVSVTLNEAGISNASIKQDTTEISTNIESFVAKYNELMSNLNESTKYDVKTKTAGNFQNVSEIKALKSSINRQLLSVDSEGRSLSQYGVELNSEGILLFDSSVFDQKMSSDSEGLESFFRGSTTVDQTKTTGLAISGPIDFTSGDLQINGTDIVVNLNNGSAELNAQALKNAVNSAKITGVEAILNNDGTGVNLISTAGYNIAIEGDATKITSSGLNVGTTYGNSETTDGYFTKFNSLLAGYISGDNSILELYESQLQTKNSSLVEEKEKTMTMLDKRYEVMATKFASYDGIIGQLNNQFQSLSMMIEAAYADK